MKFKVRMMLEPGDTTISKAVITRIDEKGNESIDQMILEGETVETDVMVDPGCGMLVKELLPPTIYDAEQKAAVMMSWEDLGEAVKPPGGRPPPTTPEPKGHRETRQAGRY